MNMQSKLTDYGFNTLSIHAGAAPDAVTGARVTPIYQTASFVFNDADHAASLFGLGIPPAQYDALAGNERMAVVLRRRMCGITDGKGDPVTVGFERFQQRLALKHCVRGFAARCVMGARTAEGHFKVAGEVAGRQRPVFLAALIGAHPGFHLARLGVHRARIIGDHRARGMGRWRERQQYCKHPGERLTCVAHSDISGVRKYSSATQCRKPGWS